MALLVIVVALLRPWLARWRAAYPSLFAPTVGILLGLGAGLLALVLVGDLFPDRFEPVGRVLLVAGILAGGLLLAHRGTLSP